MLGGVLFANGAPSAQLVIMVHNDRGQPLPCRIHLTDQFGKSQKVAGQPFWHDHFITSGHVSASLSAGKYDYVIERGPEYMRNTGQIALDPGETKELKLTLSRIVHLRDAGWYSGDLHVHRPIEHIEQLMLAEDLDFAPVITWWNDRNLLEGREIPAELERRFDGHRLFTAMAGEDEREGGALLYFGLDSPLSIASAEREYPSPLAFVAEAKRRNPSVWIDIEKPFWWDVPTWLASGQMSSIGIANNHMCRAQMYPSEAWGKPRDARRLPEPRGNGFWSQEVYYHILESGLRLPPSAGSASGVLPNPVGYNRVYVRLDEPFSSQAWFRGLARGRSFVTNGPALLVTADGDDPGASIELRPGERRTIRLAIRLVTQDPITHIEVIQNGAVIKTIPCSGDVQQRHAATLSVDQSGWFLVRAITDEKHTFRFASTAPWFVVVRGAEPRISRKSAQFFLDWVDERIARVAANVVDESEQRAVLLWHEKARTFWTERTRIANAP
jgi:hypothetical protein